ncbi:hypothetical protein RB195_024212 [Necator americanus]|uniref:Ligand-gated ion channel n=1 Tax=Necator americanus TaxID=51031 RepID=A0ABR1EME2_NECAM
MEIITERYSYYYSIPMLSPIIPAGEASPRILPSEVRVAINSMKPATTPGPGFISADLLHAVGHSLHDISPFRCEECASVNLMWVRPYTTGKISSIRDLREFLVRTEVGLELNYSIKSWEEVQVAFYFDIMGFVFNFITEVNESQEEAKYACGAGKAIPSYLMRNVILKDRAHEYGVFMEYGQFIFYQNVQARVYKIQRPRNDPDEMYNKEIAYWTMSKGLTLLYNVFDVDVKTITEYRVATLIQPPFIQLSGNPKRPYEGYCIDLIELIRSELNFSYSIYEVEDGSFGSMDQNGNWNGLIGALVSGSADIALAPLSVTAERENDVDFTVPYYDLVGTTILMKKPDMEYSLFKFMKVLEWPVWLCIIAAYLFTSSTLWLFEKFSPYSYTNSKERYINDTEKREFSLKECLWFCMTSLTPQGGGEAPKNVSGRLGAATWWLFGFIIIASYSANLAAFLTVSRLEQPISSLDDLAKQYKIEYAPIKGSASEAYFRRMAEIEERFYNIWKEMSLNESMSLRDRARLAVWDYPVSDKFTNMWRYMQESTLPENMDAAVQRVLTSEQGFAFIGDATEIKYAVLTNCNLQQVGTEFSRKPYAIAVQTGHVLKDQISSAILMLLNLRRLETLKEKWWNSNPNKVVCADINNENDGISIQNIGGVFMVILCGIALSVISLTLEFFYYRLKRVHFIGERQEDKDEKSISELNGSTASRFVWSNSIVRGKSRCTFNYENTGFQY